MQKSKYLSNTTEKKEVGELAENFRKEGWVVWSLREGMQQLSHSILQVPQRFFS